jgi:Rrf2 family protein
MFSKACKYGIRAAIFIAVRSKAGHKTGAVEIAETLKVPKSFLAKILQKLVHAEVVTSVKGPYGGFYISENNMEKSVEDIISCIDGDEMFTGCVLGLPVCSQKNPCPLHDKVFPFREGMYYHLKHQTISNLADEHTKTSNRI